MGSTYRSAAYRRIPTYGNKIQKRKRNAKVNLMRGVTGKKKFLTKNFRTGGYLGIENKFYDTAFETTALTDFVGASAAGLECDPATVLCISAPAQGDGEQNRDGRRIVITGYTVQGVISQESGGTIERPEIVCVALVLDTQTNGAQLNSEDVYGLPSGVTSEILGACPQRDMQHSARFKVLGFKKVRMWNDGSSNTAGTQYMGGAAHAFTFAKKCNIPVQFTSTTAGVSNVVDNSLHIIAWANSDNASSKLTYSARIRFRG